MLGVFEKPYIWTVFLVAFRLGSIRHVLRSTSHHHVYVLSRCDVGERASSLHFLRVVWTYLHTFFFTYSSLPSEKTRKLKIKQAAVLTDEWSCDHDSHLPALTLMCTESAPISLTLCFESTRSLFESINWVCVCVCLIFVSNVRDAHPGAWCFLLGAHLIHFCLNSERGVKSRA